MSSKLVVTGSPAGIRSVADSEFDSSVAGGCQSLGGLTSIMVPHFGQANNCPMADTLLTFRRAAQDLQMIEKRDNSIFPEIS